MEDVRQWEDLVKHDARKAMLREKYGKDGRFNPHFRELLGMPVDTLEEKVKWLEAAWRIVRKLEGYEPAAKQG